MKTISRLKSRWLKFSPQAKFAIARFQEDPTNVLAEWFCGTVAALIGVAVVGQPDFAGVAFLAVLVAIAFQVAYGSRVANTIGYAVYLAYRSGGRHEGSQPSPLNWHRHWKRMKRVGESLSWGRIDRHFLVPFGEWTEDSRDRFPSFDEISRALEMGLLEESGRLTKERRREPFVDYARALDANAPHGDFTFDRWRTFLVTAYAFLSPEVRAAAKKTPSRRIQLEAWYERHKGVLTIISIVALVLTLIVSIIIATKG